MLRTPGLQRLVGRKTALLTYTGRRSGRRITTPITCIRCGDRFIASAHRSRIWWRNLIEEPDVCLRLGGRDHAARAGRLEGEEAIGAYRTYLEAVPGIARAYGIPIVDGMADRIAVERALESIEVIAFDLVRVNA
jgi:deazaflavin-dependent oxidoreductase (nitroreductase family)